MTLNCVGLTQSSVIQIFHRNVGLKYFYLLNFRLLSLVTSATKVMFLPEFVRLSICLSVSKITQKVMEGSF